MKNLTRGIATFCGVGYIPFIPATWASALAVVLCWYLPESYFIPSLVVLSVAGFWACAPSRLIFRAEDPKHFVMDEVCGVILTLLWLPKTVAVYGAAFILFRILDALKPWPISRVQAHPHAWSIMLDDLLAGFFGCGALHILLATVWKV